MQTSKSIAGHSFPLNTLFVILNLTGIVLVTIGFHDAFESSRSLFVSIGCALMVLSIGALILFKGKLMLASVSRILVGSLFIVSGLIKANDPKGFSYKLEEYFEDGALAYRIKEWFGMPDFSFEFLLPYVLGIAIAICAIEIVLGVLVLIGGKIRFTSWALLLIMLFFTFLTWHTASCDSQKRFADRDTYSLNEDIAQVKMDAAKVNKDIRVLSKTADEVVVEEMKQVKCVTDCGCFGDAMKGSIGRSLTPKESLWKDLILLYLVVWIFLAQRVTQPNSVRQNWIYLPSSFALITGLSWVFSWYFPILFAVLAVFGALWIKSWRSRLFGNYWTASIYVLLLVGILVGYVLSYDPLKDYRPYAIGTYLPAKTKDGKPGVKETVLVYKNLQTGELRSFVASSSEYMESKIWEKTNEWKYVRTVTKELIPTKLASIDTLQFNPYRLIGELSQDELEFEAIQQQLEHQQVKGLRLVDVQTKKILEIPLEEYHVESYSKENYQVTDTIDVPNPDLKQVSIRDYLFTASDVLVLFCQNLKRIDTNHMDEMKELIADAKKAKQPIVLVTASSDESIRAFKRKYQLNLPIFINDGLELKVISRANLSLMVLSAGRVKGKYTSNSLPTFNWLQTHLLSK